MFQILLLCICITINQTLNCQSIRQVLYFPNIGLRRQNDELFRTVFFFWLKWIYQLQPDIPLKDNITTLPGYKWEASEGVREIPKQIYNIILFHGSSVLNTNQMTWIRPLSCDIFYQRLTDTLNETVWWELLYNKHAISLWNSTKENAYKILICPQIDKV